MVLTDLVPLRKVSDLKCETPHGAMLIGTVYLLHFDRPFWGPRQHYVGFTRNPPSACGLTGKGTAA